MRAIMANDDSFYYNIRGVAEGTSYNIIYESRDEIDFRPEIDSLLASFERSLSIYDSESIISRINRNEDVEIDEYFRTVFTRAKEISRLTDGAFDISAEPLFRAWGFSSIGSPNEVSSDEITKFMNFVGMDKISIEGNKLLKSDPNTVLNANAIAKGYSADIISKFLSNKGSVNHLVEIGGEIRLSGLNQDGEEWIVGIDRPSEERLMVGQEIQIVLQMTNRAIATSGNYRQFYINKSGNKITHTINPKTGYPTRHNLLSTTVFANDAITADAFATAFMVAGMNRAMDWIDENEELDALFICDEEGEYKVYYTERLEENIVSY